MALAGYLVLRGGSPGSRGGGVAWRGGGAGEERAKWSEGEVGRRGGEGGEKKCE